MTTHQTTSIAHRGSANIVQQRDATRIEFFAGLRPQGTVILHLRCHATDRKPARRSNRRTRKAPSLSGATRLQAPEDGQTPPTNVLRKYNMGV